MHAGPVEQAESSAARQSAIGDQGAASPPARPGWCCWVWPREAARRGSSAGAG